MAKANLTEEVRLREEGTSVPPEPGELEEHVSSTMHLYELDMADYQVHLSQAKHSEEVATRLVPREMFAHEG